ncbi:hypothetical protein JOF29_005767 [Kribbella aluminosa]|uniref:WXG100 family type VII secretion target n=1 Tax=Kribbella aluminosa TaxID=416017 RepID=A0ABS4USN2_9ACTN|nr:hypothetical protein [Kribbella aluminosa]MBP2354657.1 hypothetical protein [Kribbella aluminosa]
MAGVQTESARMVQTAAEAARIGDALKSVMTVLDNSMSGLSPMDGEIKNVFWRGHHNHLEAVDQLCVKLHRMADGISTANTGYEAEDASSQAAFSRLGSEGAGGAPIGGGGGGGGTVGVSIDTTVL